ncbi:hypothetical protein B0H13DRAFT_2145959 [Mycena leptocephala]|nr:hypothetical protein B0H13DRAFT_2145959 [Mycena leptocephala]
MSLLFFPCALFSCFFLPLLCLVLLCATTVRIDYNIVRPLHPLPGLCLCSVSSTPCTTFPHRHYPSRFIPLPSPGGSGHKLG